MKRTVKRKKLPSETKAKRPRTNKKPKYSLASIYWETIKEEI